jgi:uncharacterized protein (DUF2235 family)
MKRIIVLIDGTRNKEGEGANTNVAKIAAGAFIKRQAAGGTAQNVHYHDGVGTEGGWLDWLLGGALGFGLKQIIKECYNFVVDDYASRDEIYLFGFSRGAYAARALAGLIGASGIQRRRDDEIFEAAWQHYRVKPEFRLEPHKAGSADQRTISAYNSLVAQNEFHEARAIKCVAVWDTVGSYGVPAGLGLTALARYIALVRLGFHDTSFCTHVAAGLHAVAVDEHRRPFVPTLWTIAKGQHAHGHVEQTWFAGSHCNVGGGYADSGLSDQALIWMIARVQALTGLEFDVRAIRANTKPNLAAAVVDSTRGWLIDEWFPHYRVVLSADAIRHGYFSSRPDPTQENINERVHWSVVDKRNLMVGAKYDPRNLPPRIAPEKIAAVTNEEKALL